MVDRLAATPGLLRRRSWGGIRSGTDTTSASGFPASRLGYATGSEGGRPVGSAQGGKLRPQPPPASSAPASSGLRPVHLSLLLLSPAGEAHGTWTSLRRDRLSLCRRLISVF